MRVVPRSAIALAMVFAMAVPSVVSAQIEEDRIPLQTALKEIYRLREEYADAFNKKNAMSLAGMYSADAVVIRSNGKSLVGYDDIKTAFAAEAPNYPHMVLTSDTVRVYGNTAVDVGTIAFHPPGGGESLERYMVVLRRTMGAWKLIRAISVPVVK